MRVLGSSLKCFWTGDIGLASNNAFSVHKTKSSSRFQRNCIRTRPELDHPAFVCHKWPMKRELGWLLLAWLALAAIMFAFSRPDLDAPGLYYDEAVYGHMTKDFFRHCAAEQHMPGNQTINFLGRPLPLFVQGYLGAAKCWMLLPFFAVFGPGAVVMRAAMLCWTLAGLLLFMLWVWRLLGPVAAIIGGCLLGLDPSFLFFSVWEWGSVVPSFVFRFGGFLFVLLWWRKRKGFWLFLAGLAFGLGFFNKIDFAIILLSSGIALLAAFGKEILHIIGELPKQVALGGLGFLIGAAPALWYLPRTLGYVFSGQTSEAGEISEKFKTIQQMFDGSYTWRVLARGGDLPRPLDHLRGLLSPFGVVLILTLFFAFIFVVRHFHRRKSAGEPTKGVLSFPDRLMTFFLLSTVLIFSLTWLLPGATRIHHWTLVYPFPQMLILSVALSVIRNPDLRIPKCFALAAIIAVVAGHTVALAKTRALVEKTGGRGLWSNSLDSFAGEVRHRSDLVLVSMDWGLEEQLAFLTEGPRLLEPIWQMQQDVPFQISTATNYIYLAHPPEYRVFPHDEELLQVARSHDPAKVSIREHKDRERQTVFFTIQFLGE